MSELICGGRRGVRRWSNDGQHGKEEWRMGWGRKGEAKLELLLSGEKQGEDKGEGEQTCCLQREIDGSRW